MHLLYFFDNKRYLSCLLLYKRFFTYYRRMFLVLSLTTGMFIALSGVSWEFFVALRAFFCWGTRTLVLILSNYLFTGARKIFQIPVVLSKRPKNILSINIRFDVLGTLVRTNVSSEGRIITFSATVALEHWTAKCVSRDWFTGQKHL